MSSLKLPCKLTIYCQRGSERILLVDDEPAVMEMATSILEHLGYKVTCQTDSVSALEIFRSSPDEFDLVITDYTMPKLTGLDFAREVRRIRPDMPILLCTGFSEKITPDQHERAWHGTPDEALWHESKYPRRSERFSMRERGADLKREIKRVLVVDDEQNICAMLTKFLRSSGYSCESFTDPAKALEVLKTKRFRSRYLRY